MTRGSRQYWQKRRAVRRLPRVRSHASSGSEAKLDNIVAYKVGMSTLMMIDDSESPSKQQEISKACTIVEIPDMEIYGLRFYRKNTITNYREVACEVYSKALMQKFGFKNATKNDESKLPELTQNIDKYSDVTALIVAYPKATSAEQNHIERFESYVNAKDIKSKLEFLVSNLGKEINVSQAFKTGEYVDVSSITIGKGWQGVIKRYGTARLSHKATQKVRHLGTLGAFNIAKVMYTVPQAGQLGFNYRTERNKRILQIGGKDKLKNINRDSGFKNYGTIKNTFFVLDGSIPGPSKRLLRIRTSRNTKTIKEPKIIAIN